MFHLKKKVQLVTLIALMLVALGALAFASSRASAHPASPQLETHRSSQPQVSLKMGGGCSGDKPVSACISASGPRVTASANIASNFCRGAGRNLTLQLLDLTTDVTLIQETFHCDATTTHIGDIALANGASSHTYSSVVLDHNTTLDTSPDLDL